MWSSASSLLLWGCLALHATAAEYEIKDNSQPQCNGVYSKQDWGGPTDPFIQTVIDNSTFDGQGDPLLSYVIYEFRDEHLLGKPVGEDQFKYLCDTSAVSDNLCSQDELGNFLLADDALKQNTTSLITMPIHLKDATTLRYPLKKTGYYCVWVVPMFDGPYSGSIEFRNAYGELPAAQAPKLPFYGGLTIAYAVIGIFWGFLYFQNRHDILAVQNYITAILIFLVVEELTTWGFYDFQNRNGSSNIGTKALMTVTAILNAARNSFSFFLLLIVCMGYGVVKPSLGKTMWYVRILALAHFAFGLIYGIGSLSITPDTVGPVVLFIIMPLAATLTAFYVWTLNSLSATMRDLIKRKQTVKALMYKRLWWCILGSILVIFAFFFFNSFTFASRRDPDFVPNHWKTRWFILDGWLNLVYLVDICFVAYLWRPTANNRRFAMSDELAQDEDGNFEIASLGGLSDDDDDDGDDVEAGRRSSNHHSKLGAGANGAPIPRHMDPAIDSDDDDDDDDGEEPMSPVPPMPVRDGKNEQAHEDEGETLFAVGDEDDKWSDDEDHKAGKAHG